MRNSRRIWLPSTTPQPAAQRVAQRSAHAARKVNLAVRGVIENMSWFTGDDGTRYELFGAGGGQVLAESLGVPLLGQVQGVLAGPAAGVEHGMTDDAALCQLSDGRLSVADLPRRLASIGRVPLHEHAV